MNKYGLLILCFSLTGYALPGMGTVPPIKTLNDAVPAGTVVKAVLLSGVFARTSIHASNDPIPVLLKITDIGTDLRKSHPDLEGAHIVGSCYGERASERVYMRLETLNYIIPQTGEMIGLNVQGYVSGEDGREGIRGVVVEMAENRRNAMMVNFLCDIAQRIAQKKSTMKNSDAKEKILEEYAVLCTHYADQLAPLLQIDSEREVDIVFTAGIEMKKGHDQEPNQTVSEEQHALPN